MGTKMGVIIALACAVTSHPAAAEGIVREERCTDFTGSYSVYKLSNGKLVTGSATISCQAEPKLCTITDGVHTAQLVPIRMNIRKWKVIDLKGKPGWPGLMMATDGKSCTQLLFSGGTLWKKNAPR
jgi:hypothetical protein